MTGRKARIVGAGLATAALAAGALPAAGAGAAGSTREVIVEFSAADSAGFERGVERAKELGATCVVVTEDLPIAAWEFDTPGDPYPAWYAFRPGLLKVFPPPEVKPYVNAAYAEEVTRVLEDRCRILRRFGLKGCWASNEPQVMPEAFFAAYPSLRGPRVDQPNRSRVARFAPCTDEPETLKFYREAMALLLERCPEIESFDFLTTDSGSGFCWAPGLYPGANGPVACEKRPMADRVAGFLLDLEAGARGAGREIEINIHQITPRPWMIPSFSDPMAIVRLLPRGLAADNLEGPDGRPYSDRSGDSWKGGVFYPVVGIAFPSFAAPPRPNAPRAFYDLGDPTVQEFNLRLALATRNTPSGSLVGRLEALRSFAASLVGEGQADTLLGLWADLNDAQRGLDDLDFGPMLRMGHVLGRWLIRPLVPFPAELTPDETRYYRRFLFQAKGESQADDLVDIQAMRMYEGWGAHLLFQRVVQGVVPRLEDAIGRARRLAAAATDDASRRSAGLLEERLEAALCLVRSADNVVAYQAQLDRVRALGEKPDPDPVLGLQPGWDRTDLMAIARREIDNAVELRALLLRADGPLLDMAPTEAGEGYMRLGPNVAEALAHKAAVMNAHWEDYGRLFTEPNP